MSERPEVQEPVDTEIVPAEIDENQNQEQPDEPMTQDGMDLVIEVAAKLDAYSKAMDTIISAIIKRAYDGDFVTHAKESEPLERRKANIGAAAAERIAVFLGIQEKNWTPAKKEWSEDRKHYTWTYEADFGFKGRWIHAVGKAGSRDKFFSYAYGQWKPLDEIQEDHVKTAAFRATRKEGVRTLLGLRAIPIMKLKELGFDISRIVNAGYTDKGKALDAKEKEVNKETGMASKAIAPVQVIPYPWSKPEEKDKEGKVVKAARSGVRYEVTDSEKTIWTFWGQEGSKRIGLILDAIETGKSVKVDFTIRKTNKGDQPEIQKVNGEVDQ